MRMIDADRAKQLAEVCFGDIFLQTAFKLLLDKSPTVDAVEVVNCGSCRHATDECDNGWLWCNEWQSGSHCGGYCHKGERRTET